MSVRFTPIEKRIMIMLADGLSHSRAELMTCMGDSEASYKVLQTHITNIRNKIRPIGHDIVFEPHSGFRKAGFRHMRLLHPIRRGEHPVADDGDHESNPSLV